MGAIGAIAVVGILLAGAGCRDLNRTTSCYGLHCPVGFVCSAEYQQCVSSQQLDVCDGQPDETPCSFPGVSNGRCFGGVCFAEGCGNDIVEPGEVCDDGNTYDGDGCSADCHSDETCGNGVIDVEVGERCDDGNNVDGDGCQADCSLPRCGDGVVDGDEACDDGNDVAGDGCNPQCTSDETCGNGVIDVIKGEQCDDGNTDTGDGCGATCKIEACGNGVIDPGEVCDDGNLLSGDGCSATCLSKEVCGNGIIDPDNGEQCDDGNYRSHDGCSSSCALEVPAWTELQPSLYQNRINPGAAYDASRQLTVMFGGETRNFGALELGDTWEYDGVNWHQVFPANSPARRRGPAMAYDAGRRVVVLFGGGTVLTGAYSDTWEYDGTNWTKINTAHTPGARQYSGMAYDAEHKVMVLFGGEDASGGMANDTWTYDGTDWTQVATGGPPVRHNPSIAYHAQRKSIFLAGGWTYGTPETPLRDTWEWNGSSWTELTGSMPPAHAFIAYDAARNRIVAFGGSAIAVWDGSWTNLAPATTPQGKSNPAVVYDAARDRVIVTAGDFKNNPDFGTDTTWEFDGSDWSEGNVERGPTGRLLAPGAFDTRRNRAVLFGGLSEGYYQLTDTWEMVGDDWYRRSATGAPLAGNDLGAWGQHHSMVFDPTSDTCLVMYQDASDTASDSWRWDGAHWTPDQKGPDIGGFSPYVYDSDRNVVVMTSGTTTWELQGGTWTQLAMSTGTPNGNQMSYDSKRKRVVLSADATYEYDPSASPPTWVETSASGTGPYNFDGDMVFDGARGTTISFGGTNLQGNAFPGTWEYNGTGWKELSIPVEPPSSSSPTLIYDPVGSRVLLVAGQYTNYVTWALKWTSGSPDEECDVAGDEDGDGLSDCDDPDCEHHVCGSDGQQCTAAGTCECPGGTVESKCDDGWDDDCDGLIDCDDPDCTSSTYCTAETDCSDGTDDDGDGAIDCADPGCLGVGYCEAKETSCGDGEDNDGDGKIDCQDLDCFLAPCAAVAP